jgi:hypothetical protein
LASRGAQESESAAPRGTAGAVIVLAPPIVTRRAGGHDPADYRIRMNGGRQFCRNRRVETP